MSEDTMSVQIITSPSGERLVVVPETDYLDLLSRAEDAADTEAVRRFRAALATGEEELLPAAMVDRLLAGDNPLRVWREHRGLTIRALAKEAGIASSYLSQIETGKRAVTVETFGRLAAVLRTTIDDLVAG
jgi:DNA-binding XRE family transcriptional regulator